MKKIRKGFTLIEMVIVLFIISLLLLIMIPNLAAQKNHATTRSNEAFVTTLKTQAQMYSDNNESIDKDKGITLEALEKNDYISSAQHKRAKNISVKDNTGKVIKISDDTDLRTLNEDAPTKDTNNDK